MAGEEKKDYLRNGEFLPIQEHQIRLGLEEGLPVEIYAKPEYDWFQMEEIRKGLKAGIDVSVYASADIPYEKMHQIRKGLQEGMQLYSYMHLKASVLRELRRARRVGVNILKYISLGYDADQLQVIRIAIENGVDLDPYLSKDYRAASLSEIYEGLKNGLDVTIYAMNDYSWRQMREIRLGLEHRLDIEKYRSKLYSWEQMREVRLGLEMGLDVENYRLLRYTAGEMRKKRLAILEEINREQERILQSQIKSEDFMFDFTANDMEVYVTLLNREKVITRERVMEILEQNNILYGIQDETVERIVSGKGVRKGMLLAKGEIPHKGEDGWYEFFFRTVINRRPKVLEDGSVDYQNIEWFEMVKEGQKLAVYHEAQDGVDGHNVRGNAIKARRGIEKPILTGKGFQIDKDRKTYYATMEGMITLEDNEMRITNHMLLDEVTMATGNIDFSGSVHILGDVRNGAVVKAAGDVVIDGNVEAATIESGGSVVLKKGMNAAGHGYIEAKKDVVSRFFEAVKVEAGGNIDVGKSLNSQLYATGMITSSGAVAGGLAQAGSGFRLRHVGNHAGLHTVVKINMSDQFKKEYKSIKSAVHDAKQELRIMTKSYEEFREKFSPEARSYMEIYKKVENSVFAKRKQVEQLEKIEDDLEQKYLKVRESRIVIEGYAYEGTVVELDGCRWEADNRRNIVVRRRNENLEVLSK